MDKFTFNRIALWSITALFAVSLALPAWAQAAEMAVGKAVYHDTSPPLSEMARPNVAPTGETKQIPLLERPGQGRFPDLAAPDGGLHAPGQSLGPTPGPILSAPGLSEQHNRNTVGFSVVPPDINGDIGLDGSGNRIYIQYINSIWGVFNVTGTLIHGPFAGNSFWNGFGGFCQSNNDGDPVVLYDDTAGRWFFSQFSIDQGIQCVAISTTSDPLGPYHRYAFTVTPGGANDYPKLGVWDDGTTGSAGQSAYTFTLRDFGGAGGSFSLSAGVMERDAMLTGAPASFVKFINPCVVNECIEGQLPPHLAGPTPPAGTCPTYWTAVDAAFDDSPFNNDGYRNHTLCVDWSNLNSSTYTEGPLVVAGSNFDRNLGNINPVNGGESLDDLSYFTMYRAQYRWFGNNASVVLNTTVDAGSERAGIRWAETRSADGDSGWFLQQDGTYAPADGIERWMGSIAQDQDGNIALGYSAANGSLFPSVRYTSRMAGDPAGTMPGGEVTCHNGTGAQTGSSNRWGDYSSMSVDPTDDCTFWYTQEYYETTGSFDFNTRICSFKFADCGTTSGCTIDADCDNGSYCDGAEVCNAGTCEAGAPPVCNDDGLFCNGVEACNEATDSCAGTPPACDDALFCNGAETCNESTGSCDAGTPPNVDDGVMCTDDSCNETTDSIDHLPNNGLCDNGFFCDGAEICDVAFDCQAGSEPCLDSCDEINDVCIGCGDGTCDPGEDCNTCAADCISGSLPGASCGNGLCETADGEDCVTCAADCNGKQNGNPSGRFCCGDGGSNPVGCGDSQCTTGGFSCTIDPAPGGNYCCGDFSCDGPEDSLSCELDCGPAPFCGDAFCDPGEDQCSCTADCGTPPGSEEGLCNDGFDNDCSGGTDCLDSDCSTDPVCNATCAPSGDSCDVNADCCSNRCNTGRNICK
jgi:hypothetical protein